MAQKQAAKLRHEAFLEYCSLLVQVMNRQCLQRCFLLAFGEGDPTLEAFKWGFF